MTVWHTIVGFVENKTHYSNGEQNTRCKFIAMCLQRKADSGLSLCPPCEIVCHATLRYNILTLNTFKWKLEARLFDQCRWPTPSGADMQFLSPLPRQSNVLLSVRSLVCRRRVLMAVGAYRVGYWRHTVCFTRLATAGKVLFLVDSVAVFVVMFVTIATLRENDYCCRHETLRINVQRV